MSKLMGELGHCSLPCKCLPGSLRKLLAQKGSIEKCYGSSLLWGVKEGREEGVPANPLQGDPVLGQKQSVSSLPLPVVPTYGLV